MAVGTAPELAGPAPDGDPDRRPPVWQRVAGSTVPPLVAVVAGWLLLAYRGGGPNAASFLPSTWGRWDSGQYLKIARGGYTITWDCPPGAVPPSAKPGEYLCGNAGWFPGYPFTDRGLAAVTGLSQPVAAMALSWTCWFLLLVVMWRLLADAPLPNRLLCLGIAAFFPGQVYFAAIFPVSLTVAGMLACLYAATRQEQPLRSGVLAALAGAAAAYSYITPVALAPALILTAFLAVRGAHRVQALTAAAGVVGGFAAVLLTMKVSTGLWNAYFLSAAKYGVGANSPWETIGDRLEPLWTDPPEGREFLTVTASQTLLTLCLVALVTILTLGRAIVRRRSPATGLEEGDEQESPPSRYARWYPALAARVSARDLVLLLSAGGVWLVPYIAGGQASTYRSEAFVILGVPLLRRLPWWLLVPILAVVVVTAWRMAPYFFNGKLA